MRRFMAAIGFNLALGIAPASAGEASDLNILGFTADTGVFAFEEYGVQDGSGFPFANRFYIDIESDTYVRGTPIRVLVEDESASVDEARKRAKEGGEAFFPDDELGFNRGYTVGANAITELSADPHRMAVNPRPVLPPIDDPVEFRIEEFPLTASGCENLGETMGFRLLRVNLVAGGNVGLIHEDRTVPASRNCPLGYRIGAIQTIFPGSGLPSYAVLIAIRSFGFEGPNHRWIAVTGRL